MEEKKAINNNTQMEDATMMSDAINTNVREIREFISGLAALNMTIGNLSSGMEHISEEMKRYHEILSMDMTGDCVRHPVIFYSLENQNLYMIRSTDDTQWARGSCVALDAASILWSSVGGLIPVCNEDAIEEDVEMAIQKAVGAWQAQCAIMQESLHDGYKPLLFLSKMNDSAFLALQMDENGYLLPVIVYEYKTYCPEFRIYTEDECVICRENEYEVFLPGMDMIMAMGLDETGLDWFELETKFSTDPWMKRPDKKIDLETVEWIVKNHTDLVSAYRQALKLLTLSRRQNLGHDAFFGRLERQTYRLEYMVFNEAPNVIIDQEIKRLASLLGEKPAEIGY